MGKIIVESGQFEDLCEKVSCNQAQAEGIVSVLSYDREIRNAIDLCYILSDYSENVTNKLYDLLEKAKEIEENVKGGGRFKWAGKQNRCGAVA